MDPVATKAECRTSWLTDRHLEKIRDFYENHCLTLNWGGRSYQRILARYYSHIIPADASVLEIGCGNGELLRLLPNRDVHGVDLSERQIAIARERVKHGTFSVMAGERLQLGRTFDYIIISDTVNEAADVQELLEAAHQVAGPDTRLVLNFYNTLWKPILALLETVGLRHRRPAQNWLANSDLKNLLQLSGWQSISNEHRVLLPADIPVVERLINRWLAPLLPWACLSIFHVARREARHIVADRDPLPSVSVIVPARNEAGNIAAAIERTPQMGRWTELIFIEGNSKDDTWGEIQRQIELHPEKRIRAMQQSGKGKGNAVREAFAAAEGDILMILDADLTMPPEELPKYYEALLSGKADFVNGVRLVYPMEDRAMQFLNMCANKLFGILFSWMLSQPIKDTLCGTKVLYNSDYQKIAQNRAYFGDFDPFGDFDLLFGAAKLNLKITDLPIRYRNRNYGDTNINRFRHGMILFRMVAYASTKLKFI